MKRPNILLVLVDQMRADVLSAYGNPHIHTPALDALVTSGASFHRAYCAQPICVPSRSSMMTGSLPHENGVVLNGSDGEGLKHRPWLGALMRDAGYTCAYFGKWHIPLPIEDAARHGFDRMAHVGNNGIDDDVAVSAQDFLVENHQAPFFLVASFNNPHNICEWARGDPLPDGPIPELPGIERCPPLPGNREPSPDEPGFIGTFHARYPRVFPTTDWDDDQWRRYLWAYYRLIEKVDARIGDVLSALDRSAYRDTTLVVFVSDHGDGAGAHRWNQKSVLFEEAVAVPFILRPPGGRNSTGTDHEALVSTGLDLLPTLCDYAGVALDDVRVRGRSVRPFVEAQGEVVWRDHLAVEMELGVKAERYGVRGRALRYQDMKYVVYHTDAGEQIEQLFHLHSEMDPGEMVDLSGDPAHAETLATCRRKLAAWCRRHHDGFCDRV
jgi:arylsulfatase A-like enzyme